MKKVFKSAVSCALAGVMALSSLNVSAFAQSVDETDDYNAVSAVAQFESRKKAAYTSGNFGYNVLSDGTAEIAEYTGVKVKVEIPSEIDGYKVTALGEAIFNNNDSITSVTIPDGVTLIGDGAFCNCKKLEEITIPDSVAVIGKYGFSDCTGLKSIKLPENLTAISTSAFSGCTGFTSITIPENVTEIGDNAFSQCRYLKSIEIPNGVKSIGRYAFQQCTGLEALNLPDSITVIDDFAFSKCPGVTTISMPANLETIGNSAFESVSVTEIVIPDKVGTIGYSAFFFCKNLKEIYISNGVKKIENDAFAYCENLTDVYYYGSASSWDDIEIGEDNEYLTEAAIHYNYGVRAAISAAYSGNGKVTLKWKAVSGATKYRVFYYLGGKYTTVANTTATSYTVSGLTNGTKYGFLVRAYIDGAWTSYTTADLIYATPVNKPVVTAYAGNGKVRLNWGKISGATKYAIYTYANKKYTLYKATTANAYNVTGLANGTKYTFLVRAYVNGKWTAFNAYDHVSAAPIDKPVITKTTAASGRVRICWSSVKGATKYAIYTYSGGKYTHYKNTTATAYTVSGLKNGTKYGFLVRAYVNGKWTTYNVYDRVSATPKA